MNIRKHAVIRLEQRCQLQPHEVRHILENDKYHPIGRDERQQHQHLLIYSEKDNECFVVVQDEGNKDVITVLPLNYHNAWEIHPDAEELAIKAFYGNEQYDEMTRKAKESQDKVNLELREERISQIVVRTIGINAIKRVITYTARAYDGKVIPSKKTTTHIVCDIPIQELLDLGFSDEEISKESFVKNCEYNAKFVCNFNALISEHLKKIELSPTGIYNYSIRLVERSREFSIKTIAIEDGLIKIP